MSPVKYRTTDADPLSGSGIYDTREDALRAMGWFQTEGGLWTQEGAVTPISFEEALEYEELVEVRLFKVGGDGEVRFSFEEEVWATDEEEAYDAAKELVDILSLGQMTPEMPDASDFDFWTKEINHG